MVVQGCEKGADRLGVDMDVDVNVQSMMVRKHFRGRVFILGQALATRGNEESEEQDGPICLGAPERKEGRKTAGTSTRTALLLQGTLRTIP